MHTAVHVRRAGSFSATVVHGEPIARLGSALVFAPGRLVAYELAGQDRTLLRVFRTLAHPSPEAATLPGVHPKVALLAEVRSARSAARVRNMFRFFAKRRIEPEALSEDFWVRLDAVLSGRVPSGSSYLHDLLRDERAVDGQ